MLGPGDREDWAACGCEEKGAEEGARDGAGEVEMVICSTQALGDVVGWCVVEEDVVGSLEVE